MAEKTGPIKSTVQENGGIIKGGEVRPTATVVPPSKPFKVSKP